MILCTKAQLVNMCLFQGWCQMKIDLRLSMWPVKLSVVSVVTTIFLALMGCSEKPAKFQDSYLFSVEDAQRWNEIKDSQGPTFAGSPSWQSYLEFLESSLRKRGVVDITQNAWDYERWSTSEWPDKSAWSLSVDGEQVRVAHYGAYSGTTSAAGVTAELVLYDPENPPESIEGKIAVLTTRADGHPFIQGDYEYVSSADSFPNLESEPAVTGVGPVASRSDSIAVEMFWQLIQSKPLIEALRSGKAAGAVIVLDASYERAAGMYTFRVPTHYDAPTLILDRDAGKTIIEAAASGKSATLRLEAMVQQATTYQLVGFLPGRDYGSPKDEQIILITHTDGPSIAQENGALAVLGIVDYFSHVPQSDRNRTLMVFLDCRHYMPGMEPAFSDVDWFQRNPDAEHPIVAHVTLEHFGELEYGETGDDFHLTGRPEPAFIYTTPQQSLVEGAIRAVEQRQWPRAFVHSPARPGIRGGEQGHWYGLGRRWAEKGLPGYASLTSLGAFWSTKARIESIDAELFRTQVSAMIQMTDELMNSDLETTGGK
jgi:hypothetical protein